MKKYIQKYVECSTSKTNLSNNLKKPGIAYPFNECIYCKLQMNNNKRHKCELFKLSKQTKIAYFSNEKDENQNKSSCPTAHVQPINLKNKILFN